MAINKNDIVRFMDSIGGGKIIQIDEDHHLVWVETDDGFPVGPIAMSQVVPISTVDDYLQHSHHLDTSVSPPKKAVITSSISFPTTPVKQSQRRKGELIFDLHIDALPTNGSNMTDVEKHQYQLHYFRLQMQQNIRFRGRRLIFIHGKGNGVLKREIRQILQREYAAKVDVHDASFSIYEDGATLVIIR